MTRFVTGLTMACYLCLAPSARAAVYSFTASADPAANLDANANTVNVWTVAVTGDLSQSGSFLGDSGSNGTSLSSGAGAGNPAWGIYANQDMTGAYTARATADLVALTGGTLGSASQSISIQFDNGNINNNQFVGVALYSDASSNDPLSELTFQGGTANYQLYDGLTPFPTTSTVPFTDGGFALTWTFSNSTGGYTLSFAGSVSGNFPGRDLALGATSVGAIRVFNLTAGAGEAHNVFFNNLNIITAVPEASGALTMGVAGAAATVVGWALRKRRAGAAHGT